MACRIDTDNRVRYAVQQRCTRATLSERACSRRDRGLHRVEHNRNTSEGRCERASVLILLSFGICVIVTSGLAIALMADDRPSMTLTR